jgi:hypothetical protein
LLAALVVISLSARNVAAETVGGTGVVTHPKEGEGEEEVAGRNYTWKFYYKLAVTINWWLILLSKN